MYTINSTKIDDNTVHKLELGENEYNASINAAIEQHNEHLQRVNDSKKRKLEGDAKKDRKSQSKLEYLNPSLDEDDFER